MLWHKVDYQLRLHDISLIVGANRTEKTKFLLEQYGDSPFTLDISKAKLAYCGGDTTITKEEWTQIYQRDCPFITVDDGHLLKQDDVLKLVDVAAETKKRLYMACHDTISKHLPSLLNHACAHDLSIVKLVRLTAQDVCAWTLADYK